MPLSARRFALAVSLVACFAIAHTSFYTTSLVESWYGPLHTLWVLSTGFVLTWWLLCPGARRWRVVAAALASGLVTWLATLADWGGGVVGTPRISLAGVAASTAAVALFGGLLAGGRLLRKRGQGEIEAA